MIDSRLGRDGTEIRRRRECLECARRFTTRERVEVILPKVVKRDGRREEFLREKLLVAVQKACEKRPVSADDLERLEAMIHASDDLTRLIRSPVISREDQTRAMAALMEKYAMGELSVRFVGVVAQNRRLFVLPDMIAAYRALLAAHRGEASVEVISAKTLSEKQRTAIGAALKKAVGATIALDLKVDPGLLGGLIVRVGSRMFDSSLSTKLQHLRLAMKGVG